MGVNGGANWFADSSMWIFPAPGGDSVFASVEPALSVLTASRLGPRTRHTPTRPFKGPDEPDRHCTAYTHTHMFTSEVAI